MSLALDIRRTGLYLIGFGFGCVNDDTKIDFCSSCRFKDMVKLSNGDMFLAE
jgi:hypothetical protein